MVDRLKIDQAEEAHFRIDEHERRLGGVEKALAPDNVAAVALGAIGTLHAQLEKRLQEQMSGLFERLIKAVSADVASDKEVTQALGELVTQLRAQKSPEPPDFTEVRELAKELRELVKLLKAPTTRTATLELPSGPAHMTVRETRN